MNITSFPHVGLKEVAIAAMTIGLLAPLSASATMIYSQDFEGLNAATDGVALNGQGGFSADTTVKVYNNGGLTYNGAGGLTVPGGSKALQLNSASSASNSNSATVGFASTSGQTLYFSFTFSYFNLAADTSTDFFRLQFANSTSLTSTNYLGVQLSGGTGNNTQTQTGFGARARTDAGDSGRVAPATNQYIAVDNNTSPVVYLVAGQLTWNATKGGYDSITMWLNPTTTQAPPSAASEYFNTVTATTAGSLSTLSTLVFQSGNTAGNLDAGDLLGLDNIRLANTWGEIAAVPEPSTVALVLLGLTVVLYGFRRNAKSAPQLERSRS